jgi:CrcB protein
VGGRLRTAARKLASSERVAVAVGGALGAWARVLVSQAFGSSGTGWPWATFSVNIGGAFLLGYLIARILERLPPSLHRRSVLGPGFCGAFTTFATLQLEVLVLVRAGRDLLAAGYAIASVAGGLAALLCGLWLARRSRFV